MILAPHELNPVVHLVTPALGKQKQKFKVIFRHAATLEPAWGV